MERDKITMVLFELRKNLNLYINDKELSKTLGIDYRTVRSHVNLLVEIGALRVWEPNIEDNEHPNWCPLCGHTNAVEAKR